MIILNNSLPPLERKNAIHEIIAALDTISFCRRTYTSNWIAGYYSGDQYLGDVSNIYGILPGVAWAIGPDYEALISYSIGSTTQHHVSWMVLIDPFNTVDYENVDYMDALSVEFLYELNGPHHR